MAVKAFDFTVDKYEQTKEIYCEILKQFGIKNPEQHIESIVSKIPEAERNGEVFGTKIVAPLFKDDEDRKAKAKDVLGKILSNGEISREVKAYIAQMTLDFIPYDTVATAAIMVGEGNSLQMGCGEGKTGVLSAAAYKILENPNKQVFLTTSTPLLAAEALDQLPFYSALGMADQVVLVTEEGVTTPILDENGEVTYTTKLNEEGEEEIVPATQLEPFAGKSEEQKAAMLKDAYSKRLVTSDNVSLMKHAMAGYLEKASSENDRVLLADEADFVLLDSYRPVQQTERMSKEESQKIWRTRQEAYAIAKEILKMEPKLYDMDDVNQYVDFTREGRGKVVSIIEDRYGNTKDGEEKNRLYDCIYDALRVETIYKEDRDYQVSKDKNEIISEDRAAGVNIDLPEGIKQAVEIKLKLERKYNGPVSLENKVTDTLNVQEFFSSYFNKKQFISGTLGIDNKEILGELSRHFGVTKEDVFIIPPRGEGKRKDNGKHIYRNKEEKHQAIIKDTIAKIKEGRPVLIGVSKETELNEIEKALKEAGITQVPLIYNASSEKQFQKDKLSLSDEEFKAKYGKDVEKTTYKKYSTLIKKESGKTGRITLGTNIIGRGTTIKIKKDVNKLGGLHVISDGIHENGSRNPIQFVNRAGRGSDEGSSVEMFSLDDISEQYRPSIQGLKTGSEIYDAV